LNWNRASQVFVLSVTLSENRYPLFGIRVVANLSPRAEPDVPAADADENNFVETPA
jgi:hypothetical protein